MKDRKSSGMAPSLLDILLSKRSDDDQEMKIWRRAQNQHPQHITKSTTSNTSTSSSCINKSNNDEAVMTTVCHASSQHHSIIGTTHPFPFHCSITPSPTGFWLRLPSSYFSTSRDADADTDTCTIHFRSTKAIKLVRSTSSSNAHSTTRLSLTSTEKYNPYHASTIY